MFYHRSIITGPLDLPSGTGVPQSRGHFIPEVVKPLCLGCLSLDSCAKEPGLELSKGLALVLRLAHLHLTEFVPGHLRFVASEEVRRKEVYYLSCTEVWVGIG